jgi:hypothetical protein
MAGEGADDEKWHSANAGGMVLVLRVLSSALCDACARQRRRQSGVAKGRRAGWRAVGHAFHRRRSGVVVCDAESTESLGAENLESAMRVARHGAGGMGLEIRLRRSLETWHQIGIAWM